MSSADEIFMGPAWENPQTEGNWSIFPSAQAPYYQSYIAFVQPGVTQVNFSIPMYVNMYLNQALFNNMLESGSKYGIQAQLATFSITTICRCFFWSTQHLYLGEYYP
ncbi:MAG: hypothetical protein ABSF44_13865 [Candidatus Bathyarchaeia archaeon]